VRDFDATAALISKGGRVALPKFAVASVCWRGYFIDADGNTFGIFQPDANARQGVAATHPLLPRADPCNRMKPTSKRRESIAADTAFRANLERIVQAIGPARL
jgi:hypothetical protein